MQTAAAVPLGGLEAIKYLKRANVQKGESMLVPGGRLMLSNPDFLSLIRGSHDMSGQRTEAW